MAKVISMTSSHFFGGSARFKQRINIRQFQMSELMAIWWRQNIPRPHTNTSITQSTNHRIHRRNHILRQSLILWNGVIENHSMHLSTYLIRSTWCTYLTHLHSKAYRISPETIFQMLKLWQHSKWVLCCLNAVRIRKQTHLNTIYISRSMTPRFNMTRIILIFWLLALKQAHLVCHRSYNLYFFANCTCWLITITT